jgi:hypothetical protein
VQQQTSLHAASSASGSDLCAYASYNATLAALLLPSAAEGETDICVVSTIASSNADESTRSGFSGESVVYRHLQELHGSEAVSWMNEHEESGMPYDITVKDGKDSLRYIEVKSTNRPDHRHVFHISPQEVVFALGHRPHYDLYRVVLSQQMAEMILCRNFGELLRTGGIDLQAAWSPAALRAAGSSSSG